VYGVIWSATQSARSGMFWLSTDTNESGATSTQLFSGTRSANMIIQFVSKTLSLCHRVSTTLLPIRCVLLVLTVLIGDGAGLQAACNGTCDLNNPCQGFMPPTDQPSLGSPNSCFHFPNPIKPAAKVNSVGKLGTGIWIFLLPWAAVLANMP